MFRFLLVIFIFASFQGRATTCAEKAGAEFTLGEKHRASFKFSFWETRWAIGGTQGEKQVVFYIEAPANLNGDKFSGVLLAKGILDEVAAPDGYGIYIAVFPHETEKNIMTSTVNMKKHMLEGAIISFGYGTEDCPPSYTFKISDLLKDKNNWR